MICIACERVFLPADSLGSNLGFCQICWESSCAKAWWNTMTPTDASLTPSPAHENPKDRIGQAKPPLHLIPPAAEILEAVVMGLGARKYGLFNWRSAKVRATVYIAAAKRHLAQWLDGNDDDVESGVSHLAHARACLGILLDAQATGNMVDDRPPPGAATILIEQHTGKSPMALELGQ